MNLKLIALRVFGFLLLAVVTPQPLFSQNVVTSTTARGVVKNEKGEPMPGVSVTINDKKGYNATTQTDDAGIFNFSNLNGVAPYSINLSYVGYERQVINGIQNKKGEGINVNAVL